MTALPITGARFIGQRIARKEDMRLLTGRGTYVDDVVLPGLLQVAFLRSPIARGAIRSIDASEARRIKGVRAIYTAADLEAFEIHSINFFGASPTPGPRLHPLAKDRVGYVGEPVAMVLADNRYIAEDAAAVIAVDYESEAAVVTIADAKKGPPVHAGSPSNVAAEMSSPADPELERILNSAPHLVTGTIKHQRIAHSPMEGRGIVVSRQGKDELTIHISCQGPQMILRYVSQAFGMPPDKIRILAKDVGGAFGLKALTWREELAVIAAAMLQKHPLKWFEDRTENLTGANQAREQECAMRVAFDSDGRLLAAHAAYDLNNGAFPHAPDCNMGAVVFLWAAYKLPRFGFTAHGWYSNTPGLAAYRGPWAMESLARETMLDVAAREIGIDPIELRRRNLITKADQPLTTGMGVTLDDVTPSECLDLLLQKIDVPAFRAEQAAARKKGRYLGLGIAAYVEPTAATGISILASEVAYVRILPTGKVTATMSTHSQGQGTQTTMAQIIAERLGVPFEDVSVFEDDSAQSGYGMGAGGSRQGVIGGGAALKAADALAEKVKRIAAHLLNDQPENVTIADGIVSVSGTSRRLSEIADIAYGHADRLPHGMESGLEIQYRYRPPPVTFASAAHGCIVEVDSDTGFVQILRWVAAEDCGVMINPGIVEGQVTGGLAQGIGMVLLENMTFDAQGNPTAVTFKDYLLPSYADVPDVEFAHLCTPSKTEGGFRGVGEGGAIIGPPTLINAINDALAPFGARFLELPITPSKILALIDS